MLPHSAERFAGLDVRVRIGISPVLCKCALPRLGPPPRHAPGPAHRLAPGASDRPALWCTPDIARVWREYAPGCLRRSQCPPYQSPDRRCKWGFVPEGACCADPAWRCPDEMARGDASTAVPVGYAGRNALAPVVPPAG